MESLEQRLENLEVRLSKIEKIIPQISSTSEETTILSKTGPAKSADSVKNHQYVSPAQGVAPNTGEKILSQNTSGKLLGIVGIICFIFAAIYIVKLAIDSGWLTPAKQVVLSGALGMALIGLGYLWQNKDKEYASYLPAAGIVILYLTIFGATNFHSLIPFEIAAISSIIISAVCLLLYTEFKYDLYQVIATVGAYLLPFYLGGEKNIQFTNIYFIIVSLTFTTMTIWLDSRPLAVISAYMAIAMSSMLGNIETAAPDKIVYVLLHFLIFSIGALVHTLKTKKPLTKAQAFSFLPLILFFYAVEYRYFDYLYPNFAPLFSIATSALLLSFYFIAKNVFKTDEMLESGNMLFSAALIMLVHSIYFVSIAEDLKPAALLIMAAALFTFREKIPKNWNSFNFVIKFLVLGIFAWNYFWILIQQFDQNSNLDLANGFLYGACLLGMAVFTLKNKIENVRTDFVLILAHIISIISFYNMIKGQGTLAVSATWAAYSLAILGFGYYKKDKLFAKSSLVVLLISAGKVLLYDLSEAGVGFRILTLLLTGALLYFSGFIFRKVEAWS